MIVSEQDVVDGLTRYYRELDQSISGRPPRWDPERPRGRRIGSWRMQLLATAALLLLLVGAGFIFYQARLLNRSVPVTTPSPTTAHYQAMLLADDHFMVSSESQHCATVQDGGCPAALARLTAAVKSWLKDLSDFPPPHRFSAVGEELRQRVAAIVTDLQTAALAFQAREQQRMSDAITAGYDESLVASDLATDIGYAHQGTAAAYAQSVASSLQEVQVCSVNCAFVLTHAAATCLGDSQCLDSADQLRIQIERGQAQLLSVYPPGSLAAKDGHLQDDLATAHRAADEMIATLNGPTTTTTGGQFASAQSALISAVAAFMSDASKVSGQTR